MNSYCSEFHKSLLYTSPAHGGWGVVRIAALIPESYQLFIAPFACGRHGALGGAVNGIKDRISYLYIDESDIVSGNYEELIPEAVEELLEFLEKKPKVLLLFVSCLDDLLGTDHEALNRRLSQKYPDIKFRSCHMNPFKKDTKFPPPVTLQNNIYSLLEPVLNKVRAINLIGNNVPLDQECELFELLDKHGYEVKHMTDFKTFDGFLTMGASCLNLVLAPAAGYACRQMEERLGIVPFHFYQSYDLTEVEAFYRELEGKLKIDIDFSVYKEKAKKAIQHARDTIGDYPISLDYQAVIKPLTLAKALLTYGFRVQMVMLDEVKTFEEAAYRFIKEKYPDVEIVNAMHPDMVKAYLKGKEPLCIGFDSGYLTDSKRVVDLMNDEGLLGFYGITRLMGMMEKAYLELSDVQEMIEEAGLVI